MNNDIFCSPNPNFNEEKQQGRARIIAPSAPVTTVQEKMFEIFRQFPDGITSVELRTLLDREEEKNATSANLCLFEAWGLARSERAPGGSRAKIYFPTGRAYRDADRTRPSPKVKRSRDRKKIAELEAWKKWAIEKYPDLGVSEDTMRARERLSAIYRETGDDMKSSLAISGHLDDSEPMKIVLSMMAAKR